METVVLIAPVVTERAFQLVCVRDKMGGHAGALRNTVF